MSKSNRQKRPRDEPQRIGLNEFITEYRKDRVDFAEQYAKDRASDRKARASDRKAHVGFVEQYAKDRASDRKAHVDFVEQYAKDRASDRKARASENKARDAFQKITLEKLAKISLGSPAQALVAARPSLCPLNAEDKMRAISEGAFATWSYVRRQRDNKVYAVGCAHCAFYYCTLSATHTFISLPRSVIDSSIGQVYIFPELLTMQGPHLRTGIDFVAVELNSEIHMPIEDVPTWSDEELKLDELSSFVGGYSHACNVLGGNVQASAIDEYVFVEDQGEGGNSGTLMYAFNQRSEPQVLGVYCGIVDPNSKQRPRGRICPMPQFASLTSLGTSTNQQVVKVFDASGCRECRFDGQQLIDGTSCWPGALMTANIPFRVGAMEAGSCRAL